MSQPFFIKNVTCRAAFVVADVTGHADGNDPVDPVPRQQCLCDHGRIQVPRTRADDVQLLAPVIADGNLVLRQFHRLADNPHFPGQRALFGRQRDEDGRVGENQRRRSEDSGENRGD